MVHSLSFAFALSTAVMTCGISYAGDDDNPISPFPVQQGFAISPVKVNLAGKDPLKVGRGSVKWFVPIPLVQRFVAFGLSGQMSNPPAPNLDRLVLLNQNTTRSPLTIC